MGSKPPRRRRRPSSAPGSCSPGDALTPLRPGPRRAATPATRRLSAPASYSPGDVQALRLGELLLWRRVDSPPPRRAACPATRSLSSAASS
nr:unnamed protein product [Digitaria exilis]CAB3497999.1 unnamed protein product [Digitaria exilis]